MSLQQEGSAASNKAVSDIPQYSHIFVVWMENKSYSSIVNNREAPYMNSLMQDGTLFTNYSEINDPSHIDKSQPNYIAVFAGSKLGIDSDDEIDAATMTEPNLYTTLKSVGKTFGSYAEDLPYVGSTIWKYGLYRGRHDPARNFANVPQSVRKPFNQLPTDLNTCENVVFIVPDNDNNMHDKPIPHGDNWLKTNPRIQAIINYCEDPSNKSLFILYFDEGAGKERIMPIVFCGWNVKRNNKVSTPYNHYNLTKTIINMYGASDINRTEIYTQLEDWFIRRFATE